MSEKDTKIIEEKKDTKPKTTVTKTTTVAKTTAAKKTPTKATKVEGTKVEEIKESVKENKVVENKELELYKQKFEQLTKDNEKLLARLEQVLSVTNQPLNAQPIVITQPKEEMYQIISLMSSHNKFELETTKGIVVLSGYEDSVDVDEVQFRDISRKYHNLFSMGYLTTDSNGAKILEQRRVNVAHRWLTIDEVNNLDKFESEQLIELYETLHPRQKDKLVETFLDGMESAKKEGFSERDKIFALSRVYDGIEFRSKIDDAIVKLSKK